MKIFNICFFCMLLLFSCSKQTPFEIIDDSIKKNDIEKVQKILKENTFAQNEYEHIAYSIYYHSGTISPVVKLVEYGLPPDCYCKDRTLLEIAVSEKLLKEVKLLLRYGANCLLFDKKNEITALSLAIQQRGKNCAEIFNELNRNIDYKKFYENINEKEITKNSVFWYYKLIIDNNQMEYLSSFLENDFIVKNLINDKSTLILLTESVNMFSEENRCVLESDLALTDDFEYFTNAVLNHNVKAVVYLMEKGIPIKNEIDAIDSILNVSYENDQVKSAVAESSGFIGIKEKQKDIHEYFLRNYKKID